jgi:hypothetical protein
VVDDEDLDRSACGYQFQAELLFESFDDGRPRKLDLHVSALFLGRLPQRHKVEFIFEFPVKTGLVDDRSVKLGKRRASIREHLHCCVARAEDDGVVRPFEVLNVAADRPPDVRYLAGVVIDGWNFGIAGRALGVGTQSRAEHARLQLIFARVG